MVSFSGSLELLFSTIGYSFPVTTETTFSTALLNVFTVDFANSTTPVMPPVSAAAPTAAPTPKPTAIAAE